MIKDFEARVGTELRRMALPAAPESLRVRVRDVSRARPSTPARRRARSTSGWAVLAAAAAVLAVGGWAILQLGGSPPAGPIVSSQPSYPEATSSPASTPIAPQTFPTTVDGRPVLTVSDAIAKRDAGDLGANPVAIRGFWSDASIGHSCNPPGEPTGDLEIYCHDREWGITELDEPIEVISREGFVTEGSGPWLTPYVTQEVDGAAALFSLPLINGQRYPPVPIVVVGHFDDPRAAQCRPTAKALCRDRLVIDRIVEFQPDAVPTPAPTPSPTPFPFADPPPAPYSVDQCAEGHPTKFAGWTTLASLGLAIASPDEIAYIVITKDPIPIGDWFDDPNDHTRYRLWGQRVCYAYERDLGGIGYTAIPGTLFREYPDGHHEPTPGP